MRGGFALANLADIIAQTNANDQQRKLQRQADRDNLTAMQDAGITEIASHPDIYLRYLEIQGDNLSYSPGNIALAMFQFPQVTQFGTREKWKTLGRSVKDTEASNSFQIFSRAAMGKGYVLAPAYDISQTYGREVKSTVLENNSPEMEKALATVLNYAVVPVVIDTGIDCPAYYDKKKLELSIDPNYPDDEAFAAIAAEVAHSRMHGKGVNSYYSRDECGLDAQSVSYLLCRKFGVQREVPDLSRLGELYRGWTSQEVRQALSAVQDMGKKMANSIDRNIAPPEHTRGSHMRRPER